MNSRIWANAKKELLQLVRDKKSLPIILIMPVLQVILFGYVSGSELKNITFAVIDRDNSMVSREIVAEIGQFDFFVNQGYVADYAALERLIDAGEAKIGLVIPSNFGRDIKRRLQPRIQVLLDGSDSNTATIAKNYFLSIINNNSRQLAKQCVAGQGGEASGSQPVALNYRIYYNQELRGVYFMVPGVTVIVLLVICTMLTSLSIVKEKEKGTLEQLMVTPIKPWEFIIGKLLPFPFIGMLDVLLVGLTGCLWFGVPIKGNIFLLLFTSLLFLLTSLGFGLLISSISATQQQAMLMTEIFLIPNILLSGFISPIANMPQFFQWLTYLFPSRYFIEIVRGIYLKGIGIDYLYPQVLALAFSGLLILLYAIKSFRKQLG
jgi:ABC-2 type transport system permease protein